MLRALWCCRGRLRSTLNKSLAAEQISIPTPAWLHTGRTGSAGISPGFPPLSFSSLPTPFPFTVPQPPFQGQAGGLLLPWWRAPHPLYAFTPTCSLTGSFPTFPSALATFPPSMLHGAFLPSISQLHMGSLLMQPSYHNIIYSLPQMPFVPPCCVYTTIHHRREGAGVVTGHG